MRRRAWSSAIITSKLNKEKVNVENIGKETVEVVIKRKFEV